MRTPQDLVGVWQHAQERVRRIAQVNEALDGLLAAVAERANKLLVTLQCAGLVGRRDGDSTREDVVEEASGSRSN